MRTEYCVLVGLALLVPISFGYGQGSKIANGGPRPGFSHSRSSSLMIRGGLDQSVNSPMKSVNGMVRGGFVKVIQAVTVSGVQTEAVSVVAVALRGGAAGGGWPALAWFEWGTSPALAAHDSTAKRVIGSSVQVSPVRDTLRGLKPGTVYYVRIVASNSLGTWKGSISQVQTTSYPATYSLANDLAFPSYGKKSDYKTTDFRLVGLPGDAHGDIASYLDGAPGLNWEAVWDDGSSTNWRRVYSASGGFVFSVGRAYWLLHVGSWALAATVQASALDTLGCVQVPLHPGWNLITNPFTSPIPWSLVQSQNMPAISEPLWRYNGNWDNPDTLLPYVGYAFDNRDSRPFMRFPFGTNLLLHKSLSLPDSIAWRVSVQLQTGDYNEHIAAFGLSAAVVRGNLPRSFRKPREVGEIPGVSFNRSSWDGEAGAFATDLRPPSDNLQTWNMEISGPPGKSMNLGFTGVSVIPPRYDVCLIDDDWARCVDLRKSTTYQFVHVKSVSPFRILVGSPDDIHRLVQKMLPTEFALGNNFPNPFNPSTTIPVSIPKKGEVSLKVYNVLGQQILVIHHGVLDPGRYWFTWDANDERGSHVASGVYLARLSSGNGQHRVIKMIVLK